MSHLAGLVLRAVGISPFFMPWHVAKSDSCPASKPWAVIKDADGSVVGCHESQSDADSQLAALYASERGGSFDYETRRFEVEEIRLLDPQGDTQTISGHALVYNKRSEDLGGFTESIEPGAISDSLKSHEVVALWDHKTWLPLGRTGNGTLRLKEDSRGLYFENDMPNTSYARDLIESMRRKDVTRMSFGFTVPRGGEDWKFENGTLLRSLKKITVFDVSPVTFAAYPQTNVALQSRAAEMRSKLETPGADAAEFKRQSKAREEFLLSTASSLELKDIIFRARILGGQKKEK